LFTWPSAGAGLPDNVMAAGQSIPLSVAKGTKALGFLTSASNGPVTQDVTVTYSDGSQASEPLCADDWTLGGSNAGAQAVTCKGAGLVAATAYRNTPLGSDAHLTDVFGTRIPLDPTKTAVSLTMPPAAAGAQVTLGLLHVFAISSDTLTGPVTQPGSTLPEAPWVPMLAITGFGAGVYVLRRRRRA